MTREEFLEELEEARSLISGAEKSWEVYDVQIDLENTFTFAKKEEWFTDEDKEKIKKLISFAENIMDELEEEEVLEEDELYDDW